MIKKKRRARPQQPVVLARREYSSSWGQRLQWCPQLQCLPVPVDESKGMRCMQHSSRVAVKHLCRPSLSSSQEKYQPTNLQGGSHISMWHLVGPRPSAACLGGARGDLPRRQGRFSRYQTQTGTVWDKFVEKSSEPRRIRTDNRGSESDDMFHAYTSGDMYVRRKVYRGATSSYSQLSQKVTVRDHADAPGDQGILRR